MQITAVLYATRKYEMPAITSRKSWSSTTRREDGESALRLVRSPYPDPLSWP
jgi:hypothetical protein